MEKKTSGGFKRNMKHELSFFTAHIHIFFSFSISCIDIDPRISRDEDLSVFESTLEAPGHPDSLSH